MATGRETAEFIAEQCAGAGRIALRRMFGEYGLYCDGRIVALICDDALYVKPTAAGRALAGDVAEGPPYPGAKPHLVIPGERWDDAAWMAAVIRASADALPDPPPKRPRAPRRGAVTRSGGSPTG